MCKGCFKFDPVDIHRWIQKYLKESSFQTIVLMTIMTLTLIYMYCCLRSSLRKFPSPKVKKQQKTIKIWFACLTIAYMFRWGVGVV